MIAAGQIAEMIGTRMRAARKSAGLSIDAASIAAMISVNAIGRLEKGERLGHVYTILALCDAYGCDPAEIFAGIIVGYE